MKELSTPAFQKAIGTGVSSNYISRRLFPTAPQTWPKTTAVRAALIRKWMLKQTGISGSALNLSEHHSPPLHQRAQVISHVLLHFVFLKALAPGSQ